MAKIKEIAEFLDKEFNISSIEDSSNNGIQVETRKDIKKIGFAVDGCIEVFEKAKKEGCDLVIVHHGISWNDSLKKITENNYDRIACLIRNDLGLYAAHLPLDLHKRYGNNIVIAQLLNLKKINEFGNYHGTAIGYAGELKKELTIEELAKLIEEKLDTGVRILNFGKKKIKTISIVSGGGSSALTESIIKEYDCFLTGEARHSDYHLTKEGKTNLIIAGHYATEVFGVKALMPILMKKFKVKTVFIDVPTGF